jgi:hypothetical protein
VAALLEHARAGLEARTLLAAETLGRRTRLDRGVSIGGTPPPAGVAGAAAGRLWGRDNRPDGAAVDEGLKAQAQAQAKEQARGVLAVTAELRSSRQLQVGRGRG